jgi:hypothetical protein
MKRLRVEKPNKPKQVRRYDAPRAGYRRWTTQVRLDLFEDFCKVAANEDKVLIDAVEEALENWTYHEGDIKNDHE